MATWSEETEVRLINLIQERPALYDITERRYSNRVVKAHLWREIEDKLVVSGKISPLVVQLKHYNFFILYVNIFFFPLVRLIVILFDNIYWSFQHKLP